MYDFAVLRALPLLLLVGCDRLGVVDSLTDPVVAQGIFVGVDVPAIYAEELANAEGFPYTAVCNVFLASVSDPSALAEAPVAGATLRLRSSANGSLTFREVTDEPGKYTLDATDGLVYEPGDDVIVSFEHEGSEARLAVLAPEAPSIEVPGAVDRDSAVDVDLSDYRYDNAVGATYDLDRSRLWWDNLPASVDDVYAFTHAEGPVDGIELPREAFPRVGTYVVGVAGMEVADPVGFEGVNTTLSAFVAGRLSVRVTAVTD